MNPTRLRECLDVIGWSQRALADHLGLHETRVRRWASGRHPVPSNVAAWLDYLAAAHQARPAPDGWNNESSHVTHVEAAT